MKSLNLKALLPILAICFAITSCDLEEAVPADSVMSEEVSLNASSGAMVYKDKYELDFSEGYWYLYTGCTEEPLRITDGIWRTHFTIVYNNNKAMIHYHTNTSNFKLLDELTGMRYTGSWVSKTKQQYDIPDFYPYHFKNSLSFVIATSGKGNNIMVKADFHIKVDADGNVTTYTDNYRADCQK